MCLLSLARQPIQPSAKRQIGTAVSYFFQMTKIDWENLGFNIMETNSFLKFIWRDGNWDDGELVRNTQNINISLYASPFHYGQACFEGLKAFRDPHGKVRIFRPELNAKRMQKSCEAISMPYPDENMFIDGVVRLVKDNLEFVPPFGVDGSLYIRPFVFGSSPVLGLLPSKEVTFLITAVPVGSYYKGGLQPCAALIRYGFDRAAPAGMGNVKVAGNYAPTMAPTSEASKKGYNLLLFLDA